VQADTVSAADLADQAAKSKSITGASVVEKRSGEGGEERNEQSAVSGQ